MDKYKNAEVVCGTTLSHFMYSEAVRAKDRGIAPENLVECVDEYGDDLEGKDWTVEQAYDMLIDYRNMACSADDALRYGFVLGELLIEVLMEQGVEEELAIKLGCECEQKLGEGILNYIH